MKFTPLFLLGLLPLGLLGLLPWNEADGAEYFIPEHRVAGIGVARDGISPELLEARTNLMIQSQTFSILRDPRALPGARRITSDRRLQALFQAAARSSGLPASLLEAIAYLESWGDAKAESPTGPKGIMQISSATARVMGLKVIQARRYHVIRERVLVASKAGRKPRYKTITHRIPYMVTVRDDRLSPARAIPAAANYLASMKEKFGGLDWAIFAYHCGQGCVTQMMDLTRRAVGAAPDQITVARMFFSANPAWNRSLYDAIRQQMERDFSPTYYFRVKRAEQLLDLYRRDPAEFSSLAAQHRSDFVTSSERAPHRLSVWLRRADLVFHTCDDIKADQGKRLVKALDRPEYYGYTLRISPDSPADLAYFQQASPAALGALTYVAFETRRLFEAMGEPSRNFRPLEVTALVEPEDWAKQRGRDAETHCSGQVFDIDYSALPSKEVECLRFVLNDLGWDGYLGFIDEGPGTIHVGCAPSARDFFTIVFQEAVGNLSPGLYSNSGP
jgi:soluble lytic murein transglycosylase-like protein